MDLALSARFSFPILFVPRMFHSEMSLIYVIRHIRSLQ